MDRGRVMSHSQKLMVFSSASFCSLINVCVIKSRCKWTCLSLISSKIPKRGIDSLSSPGDGIEV